MTASKYKVELTEAERERLDSLVRGGRSPARMVKRALALLRTDQGLPDRLIAEGLAINPITVARVRKRYCEEGLKSALTERPRPGQKRKLSGRAEAYLVAIACSDPPEGHTHWTLRLLADKVVQMEFVESISPETVRQTLKKTNSSLGRTKSGASAR